MNRMIIKLTAGFGLLMLATTGCSNLSTVRDEFALREMAKRSYAKNEHCRGIGRYSRDYERGWRQAYYNVSRGSDTCPPSVPPAVYWSTKYQNADGCKNIAAWYEGYRSGAAAAVSDCRSGFSKVPVVANCIREDALKCSPVEALRDPIVPDWKLSQTQTAMGAELQDEAPRVSVARTPETLTPSLAVPTKSDDLKETDPAETASAPEEPTPHFDGIAETGQVEILRTSYSPITSRLPAVD